MSDTLRSVINLDLPGPRISRHLYGHFAEHLGRCIYGGFWVGPESKVPNVRGIRTDVVEALRGIGIPNLRWPGGCFADEYHWRDGIGPRENRPQMVNTHWGNVVEDNSFGTHEFMDLCEQLGAEPYINGNVGSGTVREMSEWVEYLTRNGDSPMAALRRSNGKDSPWKVPFFGIGNEAWGCGGNMRAEAYADLASQYSTFVRDHDGNKICRVAAGADRFDYDWTEALMKVLGCLPCKGDGKHSGPFQAISVHYYTTLGEFADKGAATGFGEDEWYKMMASANKVERLLSRHSDVMNRYDPDCKIGLVFDEWGAWHNVEEGTNPGFLFQQNTLRDALVASIHFDAFHRHSNRLIMANIAQTVNVLQSVLLTDEASGQLILTPTYHVFEMNRAHHDALALAIYAKNALPVRKVGGESIPMVSMSASRQKNSALISLSNLDVEESFAMTIDLRGVRVKGAHGRILSAPSIDAHNTAANPVAVAPAQFDGMNLENGTLNITLPPHSYLTVSLDLTEESK